MIIEVEIENGWIGLISDEEFEQVKRAAQYAAVAALAKLTSKQAMNRLELFFKDVAR